MPDAPRKCRWERPEHGGKGTAAYYVVLVGRTRGLFYRWQDCMKSVANYEGAVFQGFRSIDEALGMLGESLDSPPFTWTNTADLAVRFKGVD